MRFFLLGIIAGAVASLFIFTPRAGIELYPEWRADMKTIGSIEKSPNIFPAETQFFIKSEQDYYLLRGNGEIFFSGRAGDGLTAFSGNGLNYLKYQKVGTEIEFYNFRGERFWKMESLGYPYLSHNGRLIFLLNGDQTSVRFVDHNGNEIGSRTVSGRTCTALSFSDHGDCGGFGFLDGSYYVINAKGRVIDRGMTPQGTLVKGIAVSGNGLYASVHYGNNKKDFVRVIDISSEDYGDVALNHIHPVKTSLHMTDEGYCTIIDVDRILYITSSGKVKYTINIPQKRSGHSALSYARGIYSASYTMQNASSRLVLFKEDGTLLFSKEFPTESFMDSVIKQNLVFLRGSNNLFCYSIHRLSQ
jgi:hypothetical protein